MIHLVHSDSDVLLSLIDVLSASGYEVSASTNALHGLDYAARVKPRVVLCRWEMSEMEAPEFISRVQTTSPDTRILICSRFADREKYKAIVSLGASDVILEPLGASAVLEAVLRSMGRRVPYEHEEQVDPLEPYSTLYSRRNEARK
jgi:DNA-binding NarL/FixJ family response regulator